MSINERQSHSIGGAAVNGEKSPRGRLASRAARRAWGRSAARALIAVGATVAVLTCMAPVASAAVQHTLLEKDTITGAETPAKALTPGALAINPASGARSGDVFVVDSARALIDVFNATGRYVCQITGAGERTTSATECDGSGPALPAGNFAQLASVAIDGSGHLYAAEKLFGATVDSFSTSGTYLEHQIGVKGLPGGLATDSAGNVYVAGEVFAKEIEKAAPTAAGASAFATGTTEGAFSGLGGVAVDDDATSPSYGYVYATDSGAHRIDVFEANGAFKCAITGGGTASTVASECDSSRPGVPGGQLAELKGAAVDPNSGDLYVTTNSDVVYQFSPAGAYQGEITLPSRATAAKGVAVAIAGATGEVYISDANNNVVDVYGAGVTVPDVSVAAASAIEETALTLHGTVDPAEGGEVMTCRFEYISDTQYNANPAGGRWEGASEAACVPAQVSVAEGVSARVNGLAPASVYHVRLAAANSNGVVGYSTDRAVATYGPPAVVNANVTAITHSSATVNATITPNGYMTAYQVEYGMCPSPGACPNSRYEATLPASAVAIGSGQSPEAATQELSGLRLGANYHYRFVATSTAGTAHGAEKSFRVTPVAQFEALRVVAGATGATFHAMLVSPSEEATECAMQFVTETQFAASGYSGAVTVPCAPAAVAAGPGESIAMQLQGLASDTVYHFRFVVKDATYGTEEQWDRTFATFGVEALGFELLDEAGEPYTQAGGHPADLTTSITLGSTPYLTYRSPDGNLKDVRVHLPAGLVGNPAAVEQCTRWESERFRCSPASQVGMLTLTLTETNGGEQEVTTKPLYELVPPTGVAAQFGARFNNFANAFINAKLRTGGDYGIDAESLNITGLANVTSVSVTMWGVPGDPGHDGLRYCRNVSVGGSYESPPCEESAAGLPVKPFLTMPTSCAHSPAASAEADSYQNPGDFSVPTRAKAVTGVTGCGKLHFNPRLEVTPEAKRSDSPTGVKIDLRVPQEESATGLAEADLKDAAVKLSAGITVNPGAASGKLEGCPLLKGKVAHSEDEVGVNLENSEAAKCPDASKIGEVELETPLFPHRVFRGGVYVAQQGDAGAAHGTNPFGSLLAIYVTIDEPQTGVVIKLAGNVEANPATGQLTTTFSENPQLPFEDLRVMLFGGERAALATPRTCGTYETTSLLEPWSHQGAEGETGTPDAEPFSAFAISSGPGGGACGASGFAPLFVVGTSNNQAGGYSPFTMTLQRKDGEQRLGTVAMTMPEGLAGMISKVPLCDEPQAQDGACAAASQIGHVTAEAGVGGEPVTLPQPGKPQDPVYLTGPYEGAPFGLSIVVPAEAGPFNLGTVNVRAKLEVDPHTAQVTVVSAPMPTMLQGIPLDVKAINVTVDKAGFMFNPTSCEPTSVTGTIGSAEGASAAVSSRFQAAGCRGMAFKPGFKVLIHAHHSRKDGVYAHFVVTSGPGQANIKSVLVKLPGRLPARLDTLKRSCTEQQFAKDPAGCPSGSKVGHATAYTPVLPVPLKGTAIFVSHGGAAYPDLDVVLKGDGVSVILTGSTHIDNKTGVTTSHFKSVPDVPITRFDLVLPAQRYSALGANGNLCYRTVVKKKRVRVRRHGKWVHVVKKTHRQIKRTITMPTTITGQNGAVVKKNAKVAVTGCGKGKAARHHGKRHKKH